MKLLKLFPVTKALWGWLTLAYNFMVEWSKYALANVNGEQEPPVQKVQKCLKEEIK